MNHTKTYHKLLVVVLTMSQLASGFGDKTIFVPRSQSVNAARDLVGWQRDINQFDGGDWFWTTAITGEYNRTFKPCKIANSLFGGQCLQFSGSRVAERGANDILADYFGLPADFQSTVSVCPQITNGIIDFSSYVGLDTIWDGLYVRWHTPLVYTKWNLGLCERIQDEGTAFHPAGYMGPVRIEREELATSVTQAWCCPITYGDVREGFKYGRVCQCASKTNFSDTELAVGWNFAQDTWYHAGINLRATLPWSERPNPCLLFAPQIGNGHHTGIGMGFTSHVDVWEGEHDQRVALYFDANAIHLFATNQLRSYDLKNNGAGSRYMLLERFSPGDGSLVSSGPFVGTFPTQYAQELIPAINITTLCSQISIGVEADLVVKGTYYRGGWGVELGYGFWARSKEKLECRSRIADNVYAVKGDAQIYGFGGAGFTESAPLSATQHLATLHGGQFAGNFVTTPVPVTGGHQQFKNYNADNPIVARDITLGFLRALNPTDAAALGLAAGNQQVFSSLTSLMLTDADIDEVSALSPQLYSQKIFVHSDYRWADTKYTPFIGVGGEAEWATACKIACTGFAQWGVWIKGGVDW